MCLMSGLAGRVPAARMQLGANLISMLAAAAFLGRRAGGTSSVAIAVGLTAPFTMGTGSASAFALALCTVIVESCSCGSVLAVGVELLRSTVVGRVALTMDIRA
jgi:hypothetical protein